MSYTPVSNGGDKDDVIIVTREEERREAASYSSGEQVSCAANICSAVLLLCLLILVVAVTILSAALARIVTSQPTHIFNVLQQDTLPLLLDNSTATINTTTTTTTNSSTDAVDTFIHYTPSQAIHCLQQLSGPFLLLGNSIMRGVFAFLNSLVNQWPELTRSQQKALCERDEVSGSYVKNCNFSSLQQSIPIYFDLTIEYCDALAITKLLYHSPYNWSSVWIMLGHYPVEKRYGNWHKEAIAARTCIPQQWTNWTAQPNHTLVYSTPTQVCSEPVWGLPHDEYMGQLYDSVHLYIEPAFREAGAAVLDFFQLTSRNVSDAYGCERYGADKLHPIQLYPRLTNVWLNEVCRGVELSVRRENETTLFDMEYGGEAHNAPNPSVDSVMPH